MALKTYDPNQVAVILGGSIIGGWADGQFVSIVPNSDEYELTIGIDGEGTRAKQNNRSAQITLSLLQSSESNAVLESFLNTGETFGFLLKDNSGSTIYSAVACWVRRRPDANFDRTAQNRDWVLETDNLIAVEAGN